MNIGDIEKLADLARIKLNKEEAEAMLSDMEGILDYVKVIESVEVEDIKPNYTVYNAWREDVPRVEESFSHDLVVDQFPDKQEGFLKVKKIL
ncbi:MAG: Asp-tRNA(Asn)/Glu-tRNA(Gln) amidotransferase subunit GatC [Patescibacteria group bacterium]